MANTEETSSSSSSSDESWSEMTSLFSEFETSPRQERKYTLKFWEELKAQNGKNTIGNIIFGQGLSEQLQEPGKNNHGLRYCAAWPLGGTGPGYELTVTLEKVHEESVPVYWLPWKSGHTVYASRSWYENSKCQFLLTSQLSGCRFVVTRDQVLHVASNVNGALDGFLGSKTRTKAETAVTRGARSRRLSISGMDGYKKYAHAFGIKGANGSWQYKALKYSLSDHSGDWISLID